MKQKCKRIQDYRKTNKRIQKAIKKTKKDWIGYQCENIETCSKPPEEDLQPILYEEVEIAVAVLIKGKICRIGIPV